MGSVHHPTHNSIFYWLYFMTILTVTIPPIVSFTPDYIFPLAKLNMDYGLKSPCKKYDWREHQVIMVLYIIVNSRL